MKRTILKLLVVCIALFVSVGSTVAYLTDTDADVNVMTLGRVEIDLIEEERTVDGTLVNFEDNHPLLPGVYPKDLDTDEDGYWIGVHNAVDKIVTVQNTGNSPAYIRIWFAFEVTDDDGFFDKKIHLNKNDATWRWEFLKEPDGSYTYLEQNETRYVVAAATYNEPLPVGATTPASLRQVLLASTATNEDVAVLGEKYSILVVAQGVQAQGFDTAATALNAGFGTVVLDNHPFAGMTEDEENAEEENPPVQTGRLSVLRNRTAIRVSADANADAAAQANADEMLTYSGTPVLKGADKWFKVTSAEGVEGYILADDVAELDSSGNALPLPRPNDAIRGFVITTNNGTRMREKAEQSSSVVGVIADAGETLPYTIEPINADEHNWYRVTHDGKTGYVRDDVVKVATVASEEAVCGYIKVTAASAINMRKEPDAAAVVITQISSGEVLPWYGAPQKVDGYSWYKVTCEGKTGYVREDTGEVTTIVPEEPAHGYVYTKVPHVYLREDMNFSKFIARIQGASVRLPFYGEPTTVGGYEYYNVFYNGLTGYVRSNMLTRIDRYAGSVIILNDKTVLRYQADSSSAISGKVDAGTVLPYYALEKGWYRVDYQGATRYVKENMVLEAPQLIGYVVTTADGVKVRTKPYGAYLGVVSDQGTILPCFAAETNYGALWYQVSFNGQLGYLKNGVAQFCDSKGNAADIPAESCPHRYQLVSLDDTQHGRQCTYCNTVTNISKHAAPCTSTGACSACGAAGVKVVVRHGYSRPLKYLNSQQHSVLCGDCNTVLYQENHYSPSCVDAGTCSCTDNAVTTKAVIHVNADAFQEISWSDDMYHYTYCLTCEGLIARNAHIRDCGDVYCHYGDDLLSNDADLRHLYANGTDLGDGTHKVTCSNCGEELIESHYYDCYEPMSTTICSGCGVEVTDLPMRHNSFCEIHNYVYHDEQYHWSVGFDCFAVDDIERHYTNPGDPKGICSYCLVAYGDVDTFSYKVNEDGKSCTLVRYNGTDAVVDVPAKIDGYAVTCIDTLAFCGNTTITQVTLPDGITSIGMNAFKLCSSLESVTIPGSVEVISESAFEECRKLTAVVIEDGVKAIGSLSFCYCSTSLTITVPGSVTEIAGDVVEDYGSLTIIGESGSYAETWCSEYGVDFQDAALTWTREGSSVTITGYTGTAANIAIPNQLCGIPVKAIASSAFKGNKTISSVDIFAALDSIGDEAFADCTNLKNVNLTSGVIDIGNYAFMGCTGLVDVSPVSNLVSVGDYAFASCASLTYFFFGEEVSTIGSNVFENCTSITVDVYNNDYAYEWCIQNSVPVIRGGDG